MEIAYISLQNKEYIFYKKIWTSDSHISIIQKNVGKELELQITNKHFQYQRVEEVAPVSFCHYDKSKGVLLIGNLFGGITVLKITSEVQVVHRFNIKVFQQPSESNAVLFIDTNIHQTFIFTKKQLSVFESSEYKRNQIVELCSELTSMISIPNKNTSVLTFEDYDTPIIAFNESYLQLSRWNNSIPKLDRPNDQIEDVVRCSKVKVSQSRIAVLEEVNDMQQRISIFKIPEISSQNSRCFKISKSNKTLSISISSAIQVLFYKSHLFIFEESSYKQIDIEKKKQVKQSSRYEKDKLQQFRKIIKYSLN